MRLSPKATLCSTLAIATAVLAAPRPAAAQFVGTVTSQTGANAHVLGNGQLQINVNSPQAVINWTATGTPSNGVINFQQQGAVANFQGNSSFAVLNRVAPGVAGNAISINGTIQTSVNGQNGGGTVFFYSPNGIIIGQSAVIDVGSFGLTTSNILDDGNGNWLTSAGSGVRTIQFQPSLSSGYVRIDPNAMIGVFGQNNYIALVAPRVDVQGTIRTDGVAALVGAEAATMTIRDSGLWDIVVNSGTTDPQGVSVSGSIERNSAALGNDHKAYLVSVAKNDAMTMLHFGPGTNLGFEVAGSAAVEDNVVVLSAGQNIVNGAIASSGSGNSNVVLNGVNASSNLVVGASGAISVTTDGAASTFGRDVSLTARNGIDVLATNHNLTIGGALTANTDVTAVAGNATAGDINVKAFNGKTLSVAGATNLLARGTGGYAASGTAGTGTGGTIVIQGYDGGDLVFSNGLNAYAQGFGGNSGGGTAGLGQGGTVKLLANNGGSTVSVSGTTRLNADGQGGEASCDSCLVTGGQGKGGDVHVNASTGSGNAISLGQTFLTAQGVGGSGNVAGGEGRGGSTFTNSADGAALTFNGNFYNYADGAGGAANESGHGGGGFGGSAFLGSYGGTGGSINFNGTGNAVHVTAEGFGGAAGNSGGNGGNAEGGTAQIYSPSATINSSGRQLYVSAYGLGGAALAGSGGSGTGGSASLTAAATINAGVGTLVQAYGQGGNGLAGGNGTGGIATINVGATLNSAGSNQLLVHGLGGNASGSGAGGAGEGGSAILTNNGSPLALGATVLNGSGTGGASANGNGGAGTGGTVRISSNGGSTGLTSTLAMNAAGTGGSGINGGAGSGGTSQIYSSNAAVTVSGALTLDAYGVGGAGFGGDGIGLGGSGEGGAAVIDTVGTGTVNVPGNVLLNAYGQGGAAPGGGGGNGSGGNATIVSNGAAMTFGGNVTLNANGSGADGGDGEGGAGLGGTAELLRLAGTVGITGNLSIDGSGQGGNGQEAGGSGTGRDATILLEGAAGSGITVGGTTTLATNGVGGSGQYGAGGQGVGGWSRIYGTSGTATFNGLVTIEADATGGDSVFSAGGTAMLGRARLNADGAGYILTKGANLHATAFGGDGMIGGDADFDESNGTNVFIIANNGGSVTVSGGNATLDASAIAGNGFAFGYGDYGEYQCECSFSGPGGSGGSASAGSVMVSAGGSGAASSITLASASLTANAYGGEGGYGFDGSAGGDGGEAIGGSARLLANNSASGTNSLTISGNALLEAKAYGGHGGDGAAGETGTDGGDGGDGTGGFTDAVAGAGNGSLNFGSLNFHGNGSGGDGGDGGSGFDTSESGAGTGGNGGAGGSGHGGGTVIGINSGPNTIATTNGSVVIGSAIGWNDSDGGDGGDGGYGDFIYGQGGSGGDALASSHLILNRGGTLNIGSVWIGADAQGGSGGIGDGETRAASGTAYTAGISLVAAGRAGFPLTRSDTAIGSYEVYAEAHAGEFGAGVVGGTINLLVLDSDVEFGNYSSALIAPNGIAVGDPADTINILNGSVDVDGSINVASDNQQSVLLDNATMTVSSLDLHAANFIHDVDYAPPSNVGTISAGEVSITSGQDIVLDAKLTSSGGIGLDASGLIFLDDLNAGGSISANAGSTIKLGDILSGGSVSLTAGGAIDVGTIDAAFSAYLRSDNGSILSGTIDAGGDVEAEADDDLTTGAIVSGESVDLSAGGTIDSGNITAGDSITATAGGNIKVGNLSAGLVNPSEAEGAEYVIGMAAGGKLTLGNAAAASHIGLAADGDIEGGVIDSGGILMGLSGGDMTFSSLTADGPTYLANSSMIALGGGATGDFDPDPILAAAPVASGGSIIINGNISAGSLTASAGTNFKAANITTADLLDVVAAGNIETANVQSGGTVEFAAGDFEVNTTGSILIGNVVATESIRFQAGGTIGGVNFTAGDSIIAQANGPITLGALSAGLVNPSNSDGARFEVALLSANGAVTTGGIGSQGDVMLGARGALQVNGAVNSGGHLVGLGGGAMNFGAINADGAVYLGNLSMMATGGKIGGTFDPNAILSLTPVRSGGAISLGAVNAQSIRAGAGGNLTSGAIIADRFIDLDAAGNVTTGAWNAGWGAEASAGGALLINGSVTAGDDVGLTAGTTLGAGNIDAGESVAASSGGTMTLGTVDAGSMSGGGGTLTSTMIIGDITLDSGAALTAQSLTATGQVTVAAAGAILVNGGISGASLLADAGGNFTSGAITTDGDLSIEANGNIATGAWDAGWNASANAGGSIAVTGPIDAGNDVELGATTTINAGAVTAGGSVEAKTGGAITLGAIDAGAGTIVAGGIGTAELMAGDVMLDAGGTLTTGAIEATGNVALAAGGTMSIGAIGAGGYLVALGAGDIGVGAVDAGGEAYFANRSMIGAGAFDPVAVLDSAPVASGGAISIGGPLNAAALTASAGSSFGAGAITTDNGQWIKAGTTIATGALGAGGSIELAAAGALTTGAVDAGGDLDIFSAAGPASIGAARADGDLDIDSGGTLSGSTISAGGDVSLWGETGVTLTNIDAGIVDSGESGDQHIAVGSAQAISVGTLNAAGDIGLAAGATLTAGAAQAGGDMLALAGGNVSLGSTDIEGRLGIGGYSLLAEGGGRDNFDKAPVFSAFSAGSAAASGGSVNVGAIIAGRVDIAAGGDLTTATVNAGVAQASAGGTAAINGQWTIGQAARVRSNDIAINGSGGISAGQSVTLQSTHSGGSFIGDGLTPTGYALSNGEFATLSAPVISVENRSATPTTTTVGNLTLAAPAQGQRFYVLSVLDSGNQGAGKLRVVGNVSGTGFKPTDTLAIKAGQVEIDSVTATIALQGAQGVLGGRLFFDTPRLYAASQSILDKLAVDPNYANRDFDLQTAASSRPEGYVSAGEIYVNLPSAGQQASATSSAVAPYTILVQNSGTTGLRAGFLANYVEIFSPEGMAPGGIDLVVNGQIVTETETLTGAKARDAAMEDDDPARFTSSSTINGCAVSGGPCSTLAPPPPPKPPYNPDPPLATQFQLFANVSPEGLQFGNEETIEDNEEGGGEDGANSAITPPMPLFDTGSLEVRDETDEPVSGGGNPALMGQCADDKEQCEGEQ